MLRKLALGAAIAVVIVAVVALTVIDHLIIGALVFIGMILMVATGPRSREAEESDMARARRNRPERKSARGG